MEEPIPYNEPSLAGDQAGDEVADFEETVSATPAKPEDEVPDAYAAAIEKVASDPSIAELPAAAVSGTHTEFIPDPKPLTRESIAPDPQRVKSVQGVVRRCPNGGIVSVRNDELAIAARVAAAKLGKHIVVKVRPRQTADAVWRIPAPTR